MADLEVGGQVASHSEFETNEERTRNEYRKKLKNALEKYTPLSSQIPSILNEALGPEKSKDVSIGIPDIIRYDASTLAGAYYVLHLLKIGQPRPGFEDEYIGESEIRMIERKIDPNSSRTVLTTGVIDQIMETFGSSSMTNDKRTIHELDVFQYALMIVNSRARIF